MGKNDKEETVSDKRIIWLEQRLTNALRLKPADAKKFIDSEENRAQISEFLDTADARHLYVFQSSTGAYVARIEPPEELKKKGVYFSKMQREKIQDDLVMKDKICFGDLAPDSLSFLNEMTRNVYAPIIKADRKNMCKVPDVAVNELLNDTNGLLAQMLVTVGLNQGRTLLPMPPVDLPSRVDDTPIDKDTLYHLESAIISWTSQIKAAIASEPEELEESAIQTGRYPGPLDEIAFWGNKSDNLSNLEEQLYSVKALKILVLLKKAGSTYYAPFSQLLEELKEATFEAADNYRYLKPLIPEFEQMSMSSGGNIEFTELASSGTFKRLFHFLYLLWTQSGFYNTPTRLVFLIREMGNDLIEMASDFISVQDFAEGFEKKDVIERLGTVLTICGEFKAAYFHYKSYVASIARPWKFQNAALFSRLDIFLERCHDLLDVIETALLFDKMENMRIGTTKGQQLTGETEEVKEKFDRALNRFFSVDYNLLDITNVRFDADYDDLRRTISELEERLASILVTSIDDSRAITEVFKAVDTFDGFTERNPVQQEWIKKQNDVLSTFYDDLLNVQETYYSGDKVGSYVNMPPVASSVVRCKALLDRINENHTRTLDLSPAVLNTEQGREALALYEKLRLLLEGTIREKYQEWSRDVGSVSSDKLRLPLMRKTKDGTLEVNLDPALVRTLREVYYLELLNSYGGEDEVFEIPPDAQAIFAKREVFRSQSLKLEYICSTYNDVIAKLRPEEERPLIQNELNTFDTVIQRGIEDVRWEEEEEADRYIEVALRDVGAINRVVSTLHSNVDGIKASIAEYQKADTVFPLDPARGDKTLTENEFRKLLDDYIQERSQYLEKLNTEIHARVTEGLTTLNELKQSSESAEVAEGSDMWQKYLRYVNDEVTSSLSQAVLKALTQLRDQIDPAWIADNDGIPLIDVKLGLGKETPESTNQVSRYDPPLAAVPEGEKQSIGDLVLSTIGRLEDATGLISSVHGTEKYDTLIRQNVEVSKMEREIELLLEQNNDACENYRSLYDEFKQLWANDRQKAFDVFLKRETSERRSSLSMAEETSAPSGEKEYFEVPLQDFDRAITEYERIHSKVSTIEDRHRESFVSIDVKPLRVSLRDTCKKWKDMFTEFIMDKMKTDLNNLYTFMKEADKGLDVEVVDGDVESLKSVMRWIRDCRKKNTEVMGQDETGETSGMFPPIQSALRMLKTHASTSPDADAELAKIEKIEELRKPAPEQWIALNKKALNARAQNSIVQDRETEKVKTSVSAFEAKLRQEVTTFHSNSLFSYNIDTRSVYEEIDKAYLHLMNLQNEAVNCRTSRTCLISPHPVQGNP
ncbi:dynein heavy chain [Angomonas deanei]|nr:dynein heavy chain [Angomonas deanei]|eukprot:EPY39969.1 dynein heavy chain [Angomonas deanei]